MFRFLLCLVTLLALPNLSPAGYEWRTFADDKDQQSLWQDGRQLGNYRLSDKSYHPFLGSGKWGVPCPLPAGVKAPACECPCCGDDCRCAIKPCRNPDCRCVLSARPPGKMEADGSVNYGIDRKQMTKDTPKHVLNGKEVTKAEMMEAIGKPQLPDDAGQMYLTVIGPEAERRRVLSDMEFSPALAAWKGKIKVHDYEPTHWVVAQEGFKADGRPTVYVQAPDGKVLHRQDDYRGPQALAEVLTKAQKNYQYKDDPDLNKQNVPVWVFLAGGAIVFLLLSQGEQQ